MADDKDDNGLKKAEEALKKAEKNPAFVGPQDSPKFKAAVKQLEKARANFEAAGGVSDATPAIIDPRGREVLDTPPAPTAPTSPSDQVRNAMVGMRPEGNLGELPQLPEGRPEAAGAGLIQTKAEVIAEDAKTKKRRERQAKQQAKQLREDKELGAVALARMLAEEKKNLDQAARRNEGEIKIREEWLKKAPSSLEMGIARALPPVGFLMGTFDRYSKASEGASGQIRKLRDANRLTDAAMGRAVTGAKLSRTAASVRDGGWSAADKKSAGEASSIFTHNTWKPYIHPQDSKGKRVNILVGLDNNIFKPEDSYEKTFADIEKVFKKAAKHKPKDVILARKINSRILGVMKDNEEKVSTEDKFAWNKERLSVAVYKSFPYSFDEDMRESVTNNINFADTAAVYRAMDSNAKLGAKISLFEALAASKDRKFVKFRKEWRNVLANNKGVLANSEALDDLLNRTVADSNAIWNNLEVFETLQEDSNKADERLGNAKLNGKPPKEIARLEEEFKASKARQELAATVAGKTGMELVVNKDGSWGVRSEASEGPSLIKSYTDERGRYRWVPDINSINKIQGATPAETKVLRVRALAEAKAIIADLTRHPAGSLVSAPADYVPPFGVDVTPKDYEKFVRGLTDADHDEYAKTFDSVIKRVLGEDNKIEITLEMVRDGGYDEATADQVNRLGDPRVFKYIETVIKRLRADKRKNK